MPRYTPFSELDAVLAELVSGARAALTGAFAGAYLVGSFALGDADEHSDVDFVVLVRQEPTAQQRSRLQALHRRLYDLPAGWAQHLEGSYVPLDAFRSPAPAGRPFLYLDNGARELVPDDHCDTAVVRWTLREHGIVLAGPPPADLVVAVGPGALRAEARARLSELAAWADELGVRLSAGDDLAFNRWAQPYLVLSVCRVLWTLDTGTVVSKAAAGSWALATLDPRWHALIRAALADRPDPWERVHRPAPAAAAAETLAFVTSAATGRVRGGTAA
jgi:hypothetical protein